MLFKLEIYNRSKKHKNINKIRQTHENLFLRKYKNWLKSESLFQGDAKAWWYTGNPQTFFS